VIVHPVRAISFDIHGTLIHSPRLGETYAQILGRHGIEVEPDEAYLTVRQVWEEFSCRRRPGQDLFASHPEGSRGFWYEFIDRVCLLLGSEPASRFAKAELFQAFTGPEPWEIYQEVPEVLEDLRGRGVRMVVVSNWDDRLPLLLERLGLARFFDAIVFSAGVAVAVTALTSGIENRRVLLSGLGTVVLGVEDLGDVRSAGHHLGGRRGVPLVEAGVDGKDAGILQGVVGVVAESNGSCTSLFVGRPGSKLHVHPSGK
jgi:putative hydrolase of the HAD superfamily